jgi:hypothetical protein
MNAKGLQEGNDRPRRVRFLAWPIDKPFNAQEIVDRMHRDFPNTMAKLAK